MHIVSAANNEYIAHFATFLHSAWLHNKEANFYCLTRDISQENEAKLEKFIHENEIKLTIIKYDQALLTNQTFRNTDIPNQWSIDIWARVLIPELLPKSCERVIYLDCDLVVIDNLADFYAFDLENAPVAAREIPIKQQVRDNLNFNLNEPYFNSGSLLMDLKKWRNEDIASKIIAFGTNNPERLQYPDQDAINFILKDKIKPLPSMYNFFPIKLEYNEMLPLPKVIHFAGDLKPWTHSYMPCAEIYNYHRNRTPWHEKKQAEKSTIFLNNVKYYWKLFFRNRPARKNRIYRLTCKKSFEAEYLNNLRKHQL